MAAARVSEAAGAIFFGLVAVFAAWMFEWQYEWTGMQKYYLVFSGGIGTWCYADLAFSWLCGPACRIQPPR